MSQADKCAITCGINRKGKYRHPNLLPQCACWMDRSVQSPMASFPRDVCTQRLISRLNGGDNLTSICFSFFPIVGGRVNGRYRGSDVRPSKQARYVMSYNCEDDLMGVTLPRHGVGFFPAALNVFDRYRPLIVSNLFRDKIVELMGDT